jgi:hypothetical protein
MPKISGSGLLLLLFTVILCLNLTAQTTPDIFQLIESTGPGRGRVKISQNNDIRNLVELHVSQQRKLNGVKGYRISIYMGSGQEANKAADQSRARFISKYEEVKSYKKFEYPYFKVYVGDFRIKSDALRFLRQIENEYPDAFIREDIISFPD